MARKPHPPNAEMPDPLRARRRWRFVWRLGCWGAAAAASLAAVTLVSQTEVGRARLRLALAQTPALGHVLSVAEVPPRSADNKSGEMRRLERAVYGLAADRDRIAERVSSLERNLDDMTGSIKTVTDATAAAQAASEAVKEKLVAPPRTAPAPAPMMNFPPIISMVGAPPQPPPAHATVPPSPSKASIPPKTSAPEQAEAAVPVASPPPARPVEVPLPPVRVANAASEPAHPARPTQHEYGIDVAGAPTIEALRVQWAALKSNYGPLLVGLHPLASPRRHQTGRTDYRLLIGPLPNLGDAVGLCARLTAVGAFCQPAQFAGEVLVQR
jgi:hypothetical protein